MTDLSLLQDFVTETVEHLEEMEGNLLQLETDPANREVLNDIFRSVHTIKGAAEYLGMERIAELSHKLENLLDLMRHDERTASRDIIDLLMEARDRIGILTADLHQAGSEQAGIEDLLLQIESAGQVGAEAPRDAPNRGPDTTETRAHDASATASAVESYEEEHDEELFGIFLEQLQEGLEALQSWTEAMAAADRSDRLDILGRCLEQMEPLRSSANYMGYGKLTDLYDQWHSACQNARTRLENGDDGFMAAFLNEDMKARIDEIAQTFPRLALSPSSAQTPHDTAQEDPPAVAEMPLAAPETETQPAQRPTDLDGKAPNRLADMDSTPDTLSEDLNIFSEDDAGDEQFRLRNDTEHTLDMTLLQDFIAETVEHLGDMESSLLKLESDPHNRDLLNDIFRAMHTIKGAAEYMGMVRIAELSHKLENLLDLMRQGRCTTDRSYIDLLMAARDRIGILTSDLHQTQTEQSEIEDLLTRIQSLVAQTDKPETPHQATPEAAHSDSPPAAAEPLNEIPGSSDTEEYTEEYDEELFSIFLEQLQEGLDALQTWTGALSDADRGERIEILGRCLVQIDPLRSSANYMGYRKLTALYDRWSEAIRTARERLAAEDETFMPAFLAGCMQATVDDIRRCFPKLNDREDETSPGPAGETPPEADDDARATAGMAADLLDVYVEASDSVSSTGVEPETLADLPEGGSLFERLSQSFDRRLAENQLCGTHAPSGQDWELFSADRPSDADDDDLPLPAERRLNVDDPLSAYVTASDANAGDAGNDIVPEEKMPSSAAAADAPEQAAAPDEPAAAAAERADLAGTEIAPEETAKADEEIVAAPEDEQDNRTPFRKPIDEITTEEAPEAAGTATLPLTPTTPLDLNRSPGDRRDPFQKGRRKSDRIGEQLLRQSIRVDAAKIDALMNQVGELVVSRAWFSQLFHEMRDLQQNLQHNASLEAREMKQVKGLTFRLSEATVALGRVANELQEGVMKVRMLPIAQLFNRYPRLVYDLVREGSKKVDLDIKGEETELDKMVIEAISDPLIHIIRNAVDHGIEPAEERKRLGKSGSGTIHLEAYHEGNHVVIEIADDGRGLDMERIKAKAVAGGFATRDEIDRMPSKELTGLIMQPGFSTATEVTHTSGRGVGMDVVKQNIEKLNGTIEIDSTPGVGTQFRIKIPLTLAIIPALLVQVSDELFTIPLSTVEETIRIAPQDLSTIEGVEVMQLREGTLPLVRLAELFNMPGKASDDGRAFVVVVSTGMKRVGLVVDVLLGQEEVVIKPLEDYLQEKSGFSGATILGDGRISLILDIYELVNLSIDRQSRRQQAVVPA